MTVSGSKKTEGAGLDAILLRSGPATRSDYMTSICTNLQAVHERIEQAATRCGRSSSEIMLLAVSKTFPAEAVREAAAAGQRAFGENYVQEGCAKVEALTDLNLEWHFIGPLQSNKTRQVANHFDWVHSIDRIKIAERLSAQRDPHRLPLQVCLQVNVSGEESKSGIEAIQALELVRQVSPLPHINLCGLMTMPPYSDNPENSRPYFQALRKLRDDISAAGIPGIHMDELSMGMTDDFEVAIEEGATIIRVGRAIFGNRMNK